jgi:hypothetical protein
MKRMREAKKEEVARKVAVFWLESVERMLTNDPNVIPAKLSGKWGRDLVVSFLAEDFENPDVSVRVVNQLHTMAVYEAMMRMRYFPADNPRTIEHFKVQLGTYPRFQLLAQYTKQYDFRKQLLRRTS